jgi:hypothetical protein
MLSAVLALRVNQLEANITKDNELCNRIEDALRTATDPIVRAKYENDIKVLKESAAKYEQEYNDLSSKISAQPEVQTEGLHTQLRNIEIKLDSLASGQSEIGAQLHGMRQELLAKYVLTERNVIATISERLDQVQLDLVQRILTELKADRISEDEMSQMLTSVQESITVLAQRATIPANQEIEKIITDPHLDLAHKIKFSVPIIPFILNYEAELGLGGGANLRNLWHRLVSRVKEP